MKIKGYAIIRKGAEGVSAIELENFYNKPLRVLEFSSDGGVLVVDPMGKGIAMFEKPDVERSFRCNVIGDVVCAPGLSTLDEMAYHLKCITRKGGYGPIVRYMVIAASLHRGEFCDSVLWAKQ